MKTLGIGDHAWDGESAFRCPSQPSLQGILAAVCNPISAGLASLPAHEWKHLSVCHPYIAAEYILSECICIPT